MNLVGWSWPVFLVGRVPGRDSGDGGVGERGGVLRQVFVVVDVAFGLGGLGEGVFDGPALWREGEGDLLGGLFHEVEGDSQGVVGSVGERFAGVTAVGSDSGHIALDGVQCRQ